MNKELLKKLKTVQQELKAPKNQKNTFGNYNYRSCEDIFESVKKILPGDTTIFIQDEMVNIGERYYVKAIAYFTDGESDIISVAYAREALTKKGMDEAQITGSASSYARKYALNGLLLIDDTKDSDTKDNRNSEIETLINEVKEITKIDTLRKFYNKHSGKGKELDKAITDRSKIIIK
ncbi:MAG: ERF family protein [Patescibacteria group bacterium]|jgi:hypothetical protein|nr:ERF family protein [Patescibacteria group bacterium]